MKRLLFAATLMTLSLGAASSPVTAQGQNCAPAGGLNFVCGLKAPEDLVLVPNTRRLIASGMQAGGALSVIDTTAKTARPVTVTARADKTRFPDCPGPLDMKQAILHGLSLRTLPNGGYRLYATNHGGRESVEAFELAANGASATWVGCVVMPDKLAANSVAAFRDGTILATVLTMPGKTFEDLFALRNTGAVFMWTPGSKSFRQLPGTELPGNNGIETSPDDREFYVAASGAKRIVAFSRMDPSKPLRYAQLKEFAPDNVRFVGSRLVTAGMLDAEPSCGGAPKKPEDIQCPRGWVADAVDPKTMAITEIARGPVAKPYTGTATALQVGDDLWLSSFNTDRVAYRSIKK